MSKQAEEADDEQVFVAEDDHQTDWHLMLATVQEEALVMLLIEVFTELFANLKPIKIDLVLLRRKTKRWTAEQMARLPDGIRQSIASHILCEFKYTQSVNHATLVQALMYDFLYRSSRKLSRGQVATFVVSARTPRSAVLQTFGYVQTELPGVYRSTQALLAPITLLVLNQLSREPHNALFKIFSSLRQEREASFELLEAMGAKQWSSALADMLVGLHSLLQEQEGGTMRNVVIDPEFVKRLGREMQESVLANTPTERILAQLTPEQRLAGLEPEQRLEGLKPEDVLSYYAPEQRLEGLDPAVIEAYLRKKKQTSDISAQRKKTTARRKA